MSEPACPFRGLVPYTEKDADYFFGRAEETEIIIANCLTTRVTVFYGASGVGKSSVLHAGVMRALRERAQFNLVQRNCPEAVGVAFSSWRDDPVSPFVDRVEQTLRGLIPPDWRLSPRSPSLAATFRAWSQAIQSDLVLILDQFEEYFIYRDVHDVSFERELAELITDPTLRVNVLLSLREDALARLDTLKTKIPALFDNCLRLEHLSRDSAQQAIEGPIRLYNQRHDDVGLHVNCEPALINAVLDEVQAGKLTLRLAGEGKVRPDRTRSDTQVRVEAPYLQMVMMRIWREDAPAGHGTLRLASLETKLGGAANIVRTHLDQVMTHLSLSERTLASKVFRHLVTPSGTKIAHYVRDLADFAEADPAAVDRLFDKLDNPENRVIRDVTPPSAMSKRYEIYHDLLAAPVLDWRHRFETEQKREAERRRWKRKAIVAGTIVVSAGTLLLIGVGIFAWNESNKARTAEAARENAQQAIVSEREQTTERLKEVSEFQAQLDKVAKQGDNPDAIAQFVREALTKQYPSSNYATEDPHAEKSPWQPAQPTSSPQDQRTSPSPEPGASVINGEGAPVFNEPIVMFASAPHKGAVWSVRYAPNDLWLIVTAGRDRTARVGSLRDADDFVLAGHKGEVNFAMFNPAATRETARSGRGWLIATASDDETARVWKRLSPVSPPLFEELIKHQRPLSGLAWSRNGRWLVTTSRDRHACIWDLQPAKPKLAHDLVGHTGDVWMPALVETAGGAWLATPSSDGTARLWRFPNGELERVFEHGGKVRRAAFDSNGRWLVTGGAAPDGKSGLAILWDRASGTRLAEVRHGSDVRDVVFHPSKPFFATASSDGTAQIWNAETARPLAVLRGHTDAVWSVTFTQAGPGIVTASWDQTARLWDYEANRCVAVLKGHTGVLWDVDMGSIGKTFATTGGDGATLLWVLNRIPSGDRFLPAPGPAAAQ